MKSCVTLNDVITGLYCICWLFPQASCRIYNLAFDHKFSANFNSSIPYFSLLSERLVSHKNTYFQFLSLSKSVGGAICLSVHPSHFSGLCTLLDKPLRGLISNLVDTFIMVLPRPD